MYVVNAAREAAGILTMLSRLWWIGAMYIAFGVVFNAFLMFVEINDSAATSTLYVDSAFGGDNNAQVLSLLYAMNDTMVHLWSAQVIGIGLIVLAVSSYPLAYRQYVYEKKVRDSLSKKL